MHSDALVHALAALPQVVAIGIGGSRASGTANAGSDTDLYVFVRDRIDPDVRRSIAQRYADDTAEIEIANPYWGDEDGYAIDGVWHDIVFFDWAWFRDEIERATVHHQPREGYSTCFVHTLTRLQVLHDPEDTVAAAQAAVPPYPDALAEAIIAMNSAVAGRIHASYAHQVARAVTLGDPVAVNHRVAALLACATDIAFAHLRLWHPGEKRQLQALAARADDLPAGLVDAFAAVPTLAVTDRWHDLLPAIDRLIALLDLMATPPAP